MVGSLFLSLLLLSSSALAQTGVRITPRDPAALIEPKSVVRRYCEMDAQGFRLNDETAKRLLAITTFKAMPAWRGFDVISGFEIVSAKPNDRGVLVVVSYGILGRYETGVGYSPSPRTQTLEVQTVEQQDEWKVLGDDDLFSPRILRARTIKWLRDQLATEKDPYTKRSLQRAITELQP